MLLQNPSWPVPQTIKPPLPLVGALECQIGKGLARGAIPLPNLSHSSINTVVVATDFGGEHPEARFRTYSFLFVGYDLLAHGLDAFSTARKKHRLTSPYREVCFKHLGYGPIGRCVPDWLLSADSLPGLAFTLIVPKTTGSLIGESPKQVAAQMAAKGLTTWKPITAEKLFRVTHTIAFFLGLLTRARQNILWLSDKDSLFANPTITGQTLAQLGHALGMYGHGTYGSVLACTPTTQPSPRRYGNFHVLLSIPDLTAGCIENLLTQEAGPKPAQVRVPSNSVLRWLTYQGILLKKLNVHIRQGAGGVLECATTVLVPKEPIQGIEVAPASETSTRATLRRLDTKLQLAWKYDRLARLTSSTHKRRRLVRKSRRYERQASSLFQ
jgi:hypothetical protein